MAQFSATKGPSARRDLAWISRATVSLPAPGAPVIITREPVGATRSIAARSPAMPWPAPIKARSPPARNFNSAFSAASLAASSARRTTSSKRSELNGFSMKS